MYVASALALRDGDRSRLEALVRMTSAPSGLVQRARIVLLAADGVATVTLRAASEIARYFDGLDLVEPGLVTCSRWRAQPGQASLVPARVVELERRGGLRHGVLAALTQGAKL